jgi:RNA polymerase sigma-70 factor (ECF subfamily)
MADDQVWQGIVRGERSAFELLFSLYNAPLRAFLRRYLGSADAADDVAQETFLQLWKRPNGFDPARGTLKQYLFGVARKQAAHRRKEWSPVAQQSAEPATAGGPMDDLNEALLQLEPDERALLWLREVEGYSYAELSEILALPLGTVKSKLFSARAALRRVWWAGQEH